jgi:hypothetical protein
MEFRPLAALVQLVAAEAPRKAGAYPPGIGDIVPQTATLGGISGRIRRVDFGRYLGSQAGNFGNPFATLGNVACSRGLRGDLTTCVRRYDPRSWAQAENGCSLAGFPSGLRLQCSRRRGSRRTLPGVPDSFAVLV